MLTRSRVMILGALLLAVMLVLAACAPAVAPAAPAQAAAASNVASSSSAAPAPAGPVVVQVATNDKAGKFLADGQGMTLYMFTKDAQSTSNCYDKCAQAWPPLLQSDKPTVKGGVDASLLSTTTRKDGTVQVTYAGMPLYYYFKDKAAGDVTGQNNNNVWYVVALDGTVIKN